MQGSGNEGMGRENGNYYNGFRDSVLGFGV